MTRMRWPLLCLTVALALSACTAQPTPTPTATATPTPEITPSPTITPTRAATPWPTLTPHPEVSLWGGMIYSADGGLYDDYIRLINEPTTVEYGLEARLPEAQALVEMLRDTDIVVQVVGVLQCGVQDYGGCQIDALRVYNLEEGVIPPRLETWRGVIHSAEAAGFDDYVQLADNPDAAYGIDSIDPAVAEEIARYRDTGTVLKMLGGLTCPVADYGDCQIEVVALEVERFPTPAPLLEAYVGTIQSAEPGAPYDDFMNVIADLFYQYGIDSDDPDVQAQIAAHRDTDVTVRVVGSLTCGVDDAGNCRIMALHLQPYEAGTPMPPFAWFEGVIQATDAGDAVLVVDDGFIQQTYALVAETDEAAAAISAARDSAVAVRVAGWVRCGDPSQEMCEVVALYVRMPDE
ncbi:MAG: hypothetical protein M5R40_10435 [Anaerolineae bacterium]|nr:hypothetical protein [Anaerolineae bacterium]